MRATRGLRTRCANCLAAPTSKRSSPTTCALVAAAGARHWAAETSERVGRPARQVVLVAVISAGNDRDDYGLGSVGSPGTAPDAISVAALSNQHVFGTALDVVAPGAPQVLHGIPFAGALAQKAPAAWASGRSSFACGSRGCCCCCCDGRRRE